MPCDLDLLAERYVARAEVKLAELGPGRRDRILAITEEVNAELAVLEYTGDAEAAEISRRLLDVLCDWVDLRDRRSGLISADSGDFL